METAEVCGNGVGDHRPPLDVGVADRRLGDGAVRSSACGGDNNGIRTTGDAEGMPWISGGGRWEDGEKNGRNGKIREIVEEGLSEASKETVTSILDQVNLLTTAEKLLLYLKLPSSSAQRVDPLRQPLNPLGSRFEIHQTITWIRTHLEEDQEVSMPKQDIYDEYIPRHRQLFCKAEKDNIARTYCAMNAMKPLSTADFGKVMKQVFPSVRPRRLGTRGNSRYCYAGMRKRTSLQTPQLPDLADCQDQTTEGGLDEVSNAANCLVREWAEKLLGVKFGNVQDLAHHLVTNMCVDARSVASVTLLAALEPGARANTQDVSAPERPSSKHRDTQLQLQRKLQEREVIREQKRKLQVQQHPLRQRSQSADKPRAKRAKVKETSRPLGSKSEDRFVPFTNHSSSEAECDVKPTVEYVDYSTIGNKCDVNKTAKEVKQRGLSLDFEPNLSLVLEEARTSVSIPSASIDSTPSPSVKPSAFRFSPQTVAKVQIPRLPSKREPPPMPVIHLSPASRNKYQPIQPKIDPSAPLEELNVAPPKTLTKSPARKSCLTNGKSSGKRCKATKPSGPKPNPKSNSSALPSSLSTIAKCLSFNDFDKPYTNIPSSFTNVNSVEKYPCVQNLSGQVQPGPSTSQLSMKSTNANYTSSFTSVPPRERLPSTDPPVKRSRVRNEVSIGCLEKDALDDYLHGGSNSQEQEEELMQYFQLEEKPATDKKLSQLRLLLERNQDERPASHSLSILSQRSQHRSNLPTRRRVSFETQEVPPSPNTRRRIFSFTPISPGPHSPLSRNASKPSSANASPFVSPRNTPVPRNRTSYLASYLTNPRPNASATFQRSNSVTDPPLHVDTMQTFPMPINRSYVSASAPQSPLVNHPVNPFDGKARANSFQGQTTTFILEEMLRARCGPQPIGGQFMGAGDAVVEPVQVADTIIQDSSPMYPLAKSYYRSQSVPLHRMLDATPMPTEYQDFGSDMLLDGDEATAADVGLNSENLDRIFNLLEQDEPKPTFTDTSAFTENQLDASFSAPHDLTLAGNFTDNAQDLGMTVAFTENPQLNMVRTFQENPQDLALSRAYVENAQELALGEAFVAPPQELELPTTFNSEPLPYKSSFEYVTNGMYRATVQNGTGTRRNISGLLESGVYASDWSGKSCDNVSQLEEEVDKL